MIVTAAVILNKVVSLKIHICIGEQNNSDSIWLDEVAAESVLSGIILVQYLARQTRMDQTQVATETELKAEYSLGPGDLSGNIFSLRLHDHLVPLVRTPVSRLVSAQRTRSYKRSVR